MAECPTVNPDHVCEPAVVLPPIFDSFGICSPIVEPAAPPVMGVESGAASACYLVDGAIAHFLVEVIRADEGGGDADLVWHNIADGTASSFPPSGQPVSCEPICDSICVQLPDGTFTAGSVSYVVGNDGEHVVLAVSPEGAVPAPPEDCCPE